VSVNELPVGSAGQIPVLPERVFITGANGFIGRKLMARYRALGCEVRGMDIHADPDNGIVAGNLVKPELWSEHASDCELFIHTAAIVSLAESWQGYREITVQGTRNALDVAVASGAKRFLHYSSIAAMGWEYPEGADETYPVVIGSHYRYGVAKAASEHVVLAAHSAGEIPCTVIRPGDVYGPGGRAWLLEPLKMARAKQLLLPDSGRGIFTPVFIDDLIDGAVLAAGLDAAIGQVFILWGNEPISCRAFFGHHWRWAGHRGNPPSLPLKATLAITAALDRVNKVLARASEATPDTMYMFARKGGFSIAKAQRLLGFEPKITLAEGVRRSEEWLREIGEI
jgi:nucleoside-diphosphate-sugar epimerase